MNSHLARLGLLFGCSGVIASVFFVIGSVVAIVSGVSIVEGLSVGVMVAGMAFVAVLILCLRDTQHRGTEGVRVRQWLLSRDDTDTDQFLATVEPRDHSLALSVRHRLGLFFDIPETKFQVDDKLTQIAFEQFMPPIHTFLFAEILEQRTNGEVYSFPKVRLETIRDLVAEARAQLLEEDADDEWSAVTELRNVRDEHAATFNYELRATLLDLKEKEKASGRKYVRFEPRICKPTGSAAPT